MISPKLVIDLEKWMMFHDHIELSAQTMFRDLVFHFI